MVRGDALLARLYSPEPEFLEWLTATVTLVGPLQVTETGVGSGRITRALLAGLGDTAALVSFDTDPDFLENAPADPRLELRAGPLPAGTVAELTVLDSEPGRHRADEVTTWNEHARPGDLLVVHDVDPDAGPPQQTHADRIAQLEIPGVYLRSPLRAFLGQKQRPR